MKKKSDKTKLIKSYQAMVEKLESDCAALQSYVSTQQSELAMKKKTLQKLNEKLERLIKPNDGEIYVTEHAVIRYMQRVLNIDFDKFRKEILSEKVQMQIIEIGDGNFPIIVNDKSFTLVVRNGHVITIK